MADDTKTSERSKVQRFIELSLGGGMVDIELDKEHYDLVIDKSIDYYRQRSSRAVEESFMILNLQHAESTYYLPDEINEVTNVYRSSGGGIGTTAASFEPFEAGYLNMYMLNATRGAGLATFELYMGQRKMLGYFFGANLMFTWVSETKRLTLHRNIKGDEPVILHTFNYRPVESLLADTHCKQWLRNYSLANAKMILGQARSKFASLAGPQGGVQLNGNDLITQASAEIEKLEDDLSKYSDGGTPLGFIIG